MKVLVGGAAALMLVSSGLTGAPQLADEPADRASESVSAVLDASPELESLAVSLDAEAGDVLSAAEHRVVAELDLGDGVVELESLGGDERTQVVTMVFADTSELVGPEVDGETGLVTYAHPSDFTYVPVLRDDATVQAHTVIEGPSAPSSYTYRIGLPDGGQMIPAGDAVLILDSEGEMVAGVAPAWANDAEGRELSTSYEIDGDLLTQVVDHSDAAYPVVADPWLGVNLFGHVYTDWTGGDMRVNARVSPWGLAVWAGAAGGGILGGQVILNTAGWTEVQSRGADVRHALNKPSQRQQFECHALASAFTGRPGDRWPEWNLEKWRPNRTAHWSFGVVWHRCNWKTAHQY
ncbi:MAG: DUF2599 domain-containing protein [Micrococcus sp.]|nr:DUF2599 domain-containing protein [Micrococcus sp.]